MVAPAEVGHLAEPLLHQIDVGRVLADEIRPDEPAKPITLASHRGTGSEAFNAVVCDDADQVEAVLGLREARDPAWIEGGGQRRGHVVQLDSGDDGHRRLLPDALLRRWMQAGFSMVCLSGSNGLSRGTEGFAFRVTTSPKATLRKVPILRLDSPRAERAVARPKKSGI